MFRSSVSSESRSSGWVKSQLQNIFAPTDNKLAMKLFGSKRTLMKEKVIGILDSLGIDRI